MATINRIKAIKQSDFIFNISLYSGSGSPGQTVPLYYDDLNKSVLWNQTGLDNSYTNEGTFTVDFEYFGEQSMVDINVDSGSGAVRKGGIVLRPTTYPPKPDKGPILNQTEDDAFDLIEFDLKETTPGLWSLMLKFNPQGSNSFAFNSATMVSVNGESVFEIRVNPASSSSTMTINLSNLSLPMATVPFAISTSALQTGSDYSKKGVFLIA
ncbi:MAG: hypothetical protein GC180_13210 [Bacteroidetes bacterium]|nr:hypothetical protein [Bacteroidota bacterium]